MPRSPALQPSSLAAVPDQPGLAGRDLWGAEGGPGPAGQLCPGRGPPQPHRAGPCRSRHRDHRPDDGGGRHRAGRRRLAGRPAGGAPDAVERRRQLHQHALPDRHLPLPAADPGDHARRVGRVQSVAGAHGPGDARGAGDHGCAGPSGGHGRGGRAHRRRGRCHGLRRRSGGRRAALPAHARTQDLGRGEEK